MTNMRYVLLLLYDFLFLSLHIHTSNLISSYISYQLSSFRQTERGPLDFWIYVWPFLLCPCSYTLSSHILWTLRLFVMVLMVVTVLVFVKKKLFSIKNPKAAEHKTNLGPRGTYFSKHPSTWPICSVYGFNVSWRHPPAILGQKCFIVSPVRSRCIESDVAFISGSQLGRSLMEASGSAGHESDQDTSAHPWCAWTCFWIGLKENSE